MGEAGQQGWQHKRTLGHEHTTSMTHPDTRAQYERKQAKKRAQYEWAVEIMEEKLEPGQGPAQPTPCEMEEETWRS